MKELPSRALGIALVGALAWHTASKDVAHLQEMLWLCHVATALMALGLLVGQHRWVAAGLLFHLGFGTLGWVMDVLATKDTTLSSVFIHLLTLGAGGVQVWRRGWPQGVVLPTWLFLSAWVLCSHWVTEPALNVNLSHAAWGPLAGVMGGVWLSGLFNSAFMLGSFLVLDKLLRRWVRPSPAA